MSDAQDAQKNRVYGVWWGGSSYSPGEVVRDLEVFLDADEAKEALVSRYGQGSYIPQDFHYVNQKSECTKTPGVDEDSEMHLFYSRPDEWGNTDYYPDAIIKLEFDSEDEVSAVLEEC